MNDTREYRVGTGASVMLLIFMVVCLSTLGMLSLLSARADLTLSRRGARYAQAYYEAQDAAERRIGEIARDTRGMDAAALAAYAQEKGYACEGTQISFSVDAQFDRQVNVTLALSGDGRARVIANTLANTGEWDTGTLPLDAGL